MKNKVLKIIKAAAFIALTAMIIVLITPVFQKKNINGAWNYTVKVNAFKNLEKDSLDVIFFGSSHAYCSFVPSEFDKYGLDSYVLATQQQTSAMSYYYMVEALKTQSPSVIVYETYMIGEKEYIPEDSVIYDAADQMPMSLNKLRLIHASVKDKKFGDRLPFYLTILKFHNRYSSLTNDDFYYDPDAAVDEYRGYVYLEDAKPLEDTKLTDAGEAGTICAVDKMYLDKMAKLCEENNIKFVLAYSPYPIPQEKVASLNAVAEYADDRCIPFFDGNRLYDSFGLDSEKDFYDSNHLNYSGAVKFSDSFAEFILSISK